MSMEGIEQNPIVYDLMSEMAFHHRQVDLQVFKKIFSRRAFCTIDVFYHLIYLLCISFTCFYGSFPLHNCTSY